MLGKPAEYVKGRKYHLAWAKSRAYVWRLIDFDPAINTAWVETPKTHKQLVVKLSDLRDINKNLLKD